MSFIMQKIAAMLAILACVGQARRLQSEFNPGLAFNAPSVIGGRAHIGQRVSGMNRAGLTTRPVVHMAEEEKDAAEDAPKALNVAEAAQSAIDSCIGMMGEGVDPPESIVNLKDKITEGADDLKIGEALYLMLAEQTLDYDIVEGKMVPTTMDYTNGFDPKVREKMTYIYTYGISMMRRGLIAQDALMDAVLNKVASRVKMTGEEFDKWLEIPSVVD